METAETVEIREPFFVDQKKADKRFAKRTRSYAREAGATNGSKLWMAGTAAALVAGVCVVAFAALGGLSRRD